MRPYRLPVLHGLNSYQLNEAQWRFTLAKLMDLIVRCPYAVAEDYKNRQLPVGSIWHVMSPEPSSSLLMCTRDLIPDYFEDAKIDIRVLSLRLLKALREATSARALPWKEGKEEKR